MSAPRMRRLVLGLNAATVLLVVGGILLLVIPSPVPTARPTTVVSLAGATADDVRLPVADRGAAERVVRTDIFSPRRSAPPRRYSFGDPSPEPDMSADLTAAPLAGETMDSTSASTATDAVPHLYGTMLGPVESTALLRLEASVSEPRLFRVGDRAGGYRVLEIAHRHVTLVGPRGRIVLRLAKPK